jgi:hypothetical protein
MANWPGPLSRNSFNKQVILESWTSHFAGVQNQSLAAGVLEGIFERPRQLETFTAEWKLRHNRRRELVLQRFGTNRLNFALILATRYFQWPLPATPCLQILGARKLNNLRGITTRGQILLQVTT